MRFRMQFTLSSAPNTVKRAAQIIALAEQPEGPDQDTLLGCAMLLLAVALDQALTTHLRMLSDFYQSEGDHPPVPNPAEVLQESSFKARLFRTPEISHIYPARLRANSDYVDYLTELIDRRNSLMHFAEHPASFDIDIETDRMPMGVRTTLDPSLATGVRSLEDGILTVNVNPDDMSHAVSGNPWGNVTPAEARRSLAAVEIYLNRVLGDPGPCEILIPL